MKIKTFKGKIVDGGQDKIHLSGGDSDKGYRIASLKIMSLNPGADLQESVVKVYKNKQSSVDGQVDFTDDNLLGAAYLETHGEPWYIDGDQVTFDREVVNQDIFVTHKDIAVGATINYYIELEEIKMSGAEQANVNFSAALLHGE